MILSENDVLLPKAFDRSRFGLAPAPESMTGSGGAPSPGMGGAGDGKTRDGKPRVFLDTLNLDEVEEILIKKALEITEDNRTKASKLLGISVRTLRNKLNRPSS